MNDHNNGYAPPPARLLSPQRYVKRGTHDAAKGTGRRRTELGVSLVTYITHTTCAMPPTILISCRSTCAYELPSGFHCSSRERVELFFRIFLVVHGSREWVAFVTYRRRIQLRMLQVPRSCTRAGPVGMSFLRVSTRLWTVRPLYVKKSTSSGNPDPFFFVFDDAK